MLAIPLRGDNRLRIANGLRLPIRDSASACDLVCCRKAPNAGRQPSRGRLPRLVVAAEPNVRYAMKKPFYDRFSRLILIAAALAFPVLLYGAQKASQTNRNDVKDWLPENFDETADFKWFQEKFENITNVLVTWEGCTLDDPRLAEFSRLIVPPADGSRSAGSSSLFTKVITGPEVLAQITDSPVNVPHDQALARLKGLFVGSDLNQSCAIVSLSHAGQDDLHRSLAELYAAAEATGLERRQIHMGGPPVDNVAIDDEGQKTLRVLIVISGLIGLLLSWMCMRTFKLTALVFLSGIYSAALSLSLIYYTGGKMDAVVYSMPPVVFTAALSGAIHIINYYRNVVAETGLDAGTAGRALARAWVPCLLSAGTTAIGLGSLYLSHLVPIKTFGIYAGVGVIAMVGLLYLCVPAVLHLWPPEFRTPAPNEPSAGRHGASIVSRAGDWFAHKVVDHYVFVYIAFAVVAVGFGWGISRIKTSVSIRNLFSPDAEIIQNYGWLQEKLGGLVPMEVVIRFDNKDCPLNFLEKLELVEKIQKQVHGLRQVDSVMSAWTFMPSTSETGEAPKAGRMIGALERLAIRNRERTRRNVYNSQLEQHRGEYQLQDYLTKTDDAELWRVSIRLTAREDIDYGDFVAEIKKQVEPLLEKEQAEHVEGISAVYTGLTPLVYKAQRSLLNDLIGSFGTAFLIMAVLMSLVYRSAPAGFLVMFPNVWPMALVFGLLGYAGIIVDIGTMMTASVAMGVSVDDAAHFITWFRFGVAKGLNHKDATIYAYRNASLAMAQSSVIVGFGLLVFALSSFVPTQRFGLLMFVLLTLGLFADLVLMPAIVAGPMGKFFVKGIAPQSGPQGVAPPQRASDASVASASRR